MTTIKRILIVAILLVVLSVLVLFLHLGAPVGSVQTTDLGRYADYNYYVDAQLSAHFKGALPVKAADHWQDPHYEYRYHCALLGDPCFSIYLQIQCSAEAYPIEQSRIDALTTQTKTLADGSVVYYVTGSANDLDSMTDEEIHDGTPYYYEWVRFDPATLQIEYVTALHWEGKTGVDRIAELLREWR